MKGQTTENMQTITRSDLRKTLNTVLDQVAQEDAAVMITGRRKKSVVLCPAEWFDPYMDEEFGMIVTCAIRYAIGRMTYMPSVVCEFTLRFMPLLDSKTIHVMIRDITETMERWQGELTDSELWLNLRAKAEEEKERRISEGQWEYDALKIGTSARRI